MTQPPAEFMNKYRRQFSEILASHTDGPYDVENREFVEDIASALYERYDDLPPIADWPQSVRYFFACYDLNFQVGNGGWAQAAYNVPDLFWIAAEAFDYFKLPAALDLCKTAISMLPEELKEQYTKGLDATEDLQDVFDHFDDSVMEQLDEQTPDDFWVDAQLQRLVEENRAEFLAVDSMT
ncbi:MAG: hypothetical protein AAF802_04320 [Planctomycetota bacterium]